MLCEAHAKSHLRLGAEMEKEYLKDATSRLQKAELWGVSAAVSIGDLAQNADPDTKNKLKDLVSKFQEESVLQGHLQDATRPFYYGPHCAGDASRSGHPICNVFQVSRDH